MIGIQTLETLSSGDIVTIDGGTGDIYAGVVPSIYPKLNEDFKTLIKWAKSFKEVKVYSVASNAEEARAALDNGADGIEMYDMGALLSKPGRLHLLQTMLLTDSESDRSSVLADLQQHLRNDFIEMLRVVKDCDVIVRLLDRSMSNVLPNPSSTLYNEELLELCGRVNMPHASVAKKIDDLRDSNPALGMRGCKQFFLSPALFSIQIRAIIGMFC